MPRNVEIKARVDCLEAVAARLHEMGAEDCGVMRQVDTFYACPTQRLKLRTINGDGCLTPLPPSPSRCGCSGGGGSGNGPHGQGCPCHGGARAELILYARPDQAGPKLSDYLITPVAEPETMHQLLARALGVRSEVRKTRRLFMVGQTRVHLDEVEGLGSFVELEVVLREDQAVDEGQAVADELMGLLGIRREDLVEGAYADLLAG